MGGKTATIPSDVKAVADLYLEKYPQHVIAILVNTSVDTVTDLLEYANRLKLIPARFKCIHCGSRDHAKHKLVLFKKEWTCGDCLNTIDSEYKLDVADYTYRKFNRLKDDT